MSLTACKIVLLHLITPSYSTFVLDRTSGAIILTVTYGYSMQENDDYFDNVVGNRNLQTHPREAVFGCGRRICPGNGVIVPWIVVRRSLMEFVGLNFADAAVYLTVA